MQMIVFWFKFHWNWFLRVKLIIKSALVQIMARCQRLDTKKSKMATRWPFWKWRRWKSIGFCLWRQSNLHRLISAAIGRWWPLTQPNYHFSPGGKSCALAPLNIIPKFPKEKYKFLSEFSSKSNTFVCSICMIAKGYKVFPWKLCQSKNSVCDESPPKRRTVAETFAWRLATINMHMSPETMTVFMKIIGHVRRRTFPMARPKCLMRDFTNLNTIHKAHRTNVWWTMKVFQLHCNADLAYWCLYMASMTYHSEARTKWLPLCRQHFQMNFLASKLLDFY